MTAFCWHRDQPYGRIGIGPWVRRTMGRISAGFVIARRAMAAEKTRRHQDELLFCDEGSFGPATHRDNDAAEFPQRPLILGDKWDF